MRAIDAYQGTPIALAHGKSGPFGMAYDRAEYMAQRRTMMKTWATYLDRLREGAQVIPIKAS